MSVINSGARGETVETDRIVTIPNLLSLLRLLALPLLYLDLATGRPLRAFAILVAVVWTDWIDGYVARRFNQSSRLGRIFDPISDRLLIAGVGAGMVVGDIIPLWPVAAIVGRDLIVLLGGLVMLLRGLPPPAVTDLGKSATFGLMGVLPLFILAAALDSEQLYASAWVLLIAFGALYYLALVQYAGMVRAVGQQPSTASPAPRRGPEGPSAARNH